MKPVSTLLLKFTIFLIGIAVLALCVFILPQGIMSDNAGRYRLILLGMYIPAIPFYIALYQGLLLLRNIDKKKAFSVSSIKALRIIKYCGFIIGGMYAIGMPYIFLVAENDDAPGVVLIGLIFTFAPLGVGIGATVLQKLFSNAIELKSENDLIV